VKSVVGELSKLSNPDAELMGEFPNDHAPFIQRWNQSGRLANFNRNFEKPQRVIEEWLKISGRKVCLGNEKSWDSDCGMRFLHSHGGAGARL
jgi:hypothetical protein